MSIALALDLDDRLTNSIAAINARLRTLDEQMRLADEIINDMDYNRDDDFNIDSWENASDDATLDYRTTLEASYDADLEDDDDTETVIESWEDPFLTPDKNYGFYIPNDLEDGLQFLEN